MYHIHFLKVVSEIIDTIKEGDKCKLNNYSDYNRQFKNKVGKVIKLPIKSSYERKIEEGNSYPRSI